MHGPTCIFWANLTPFLLKEWLLYHIGTGVAPEAGWSPCVMPNSSAGEPLPAPPVTKKCPARTGDLAIRSSKSLLGPWKPLSDDECSVDGGVNITYNQPWSTFVAGNPAPYIFENVRQYRVFCRCLSARLD